MLRRLLSVVLALAVTAPLAGCAHAPPPAPKPTAEVLITPSYLDPSRGARFVSVERDLRDATHADRDAVEALRYDAEPPAEYPHLYEGCSGYGRVPPSRFDVAAHTRRFGRFPRPVFINEPEIVRAQALELALRRHTGPHFASFLETRADQCAPLSPSERVAACNAAAQDDGPYSAYFLRCTDADPPS